MVHAPQAALDIIEMTSSTPGVMQMLQFSLAPAFLLVGNRIERLELQAEEKPQNCYEDELAWLARRRAIAQRAVMFSTAAAGLISVLIAALFISAYISLKIGTVIAILWVATMALLITGLSFFFRETAIAAKGPASRGSISRKP